METLQVEIKNKNALTILKGLEKARIIKLIRIKNNEMSSPIQHKGAFSRERAVKMLDEINKSREEWDERNI
jgi:hypothetical protein